RWRHLSMDADGVASAHEILGASQPFPLAIVEAQVIADAGWAGADEPAPCEGREAITSPCATQIMRPHQRIQQLGRRAGFGAAQLRYPFRWEIACCQRVKDP